MASRRLRIKPVANVPIRRGRTTENVENIEDKTEQPKVHKPEEELHSAVSNNSSEKADDQNAEQSNRPNGPHDSTTSFNNAATDDDSCKTNSQAGVAKPPLLTRKRVRPAVNIAAISRASKTQNDKPIKIAMSVPGPHPTPSESNLSEMQHTDNKDNHLSKTYTASDMQLDVEDETNSHVEKIISMNNTAKTQNIDNLTSKEQKPTRRYLKPAVNIAALSRSSRYQKANNVTADREATKMPFSIAGITELSTKVTTQKPKYEKELMSTNESLPNDAECADIGGENSSLHSISSGPKHRFAKPVSQINEAPLSTRGDASNAEDDSSKRSRISGSLSASESDDDRSLSLASTVSPPAKIARLSSGAVFGQSKGSASESDDDASKHTLGSASTITPPTRRLSEVVREDKEEKSEKKSIKPRVLSSSAVRFRKARMEFYSKFNGTTIIDRSRLTMMDLIFYNPVTNPMKSLENKLSENPEKQASAQVIPPITEETEERLTEEQADDPEGEDEEVAMPVPQVKVGPDGQIVLDERSLVIETTGAKKSRENLANSAVIVDTGTTGNGFYSKKFTKFKEWSKQETLKFYRALNIIGTDFLVMQSIFPKRSRRDLKMKFKREERINRLLVEKALRNPLDFDLTEMEKELAKEEEEEEEKRKKEIERQNKGKEEVAKAKKSKASQRNRSFLSRCMDDEDTGKVHKRRQKKKKTASNKHKKEPASSSESDEENEPDSHNPDLQSEESIDSGAIGDTLVEAESSLTQEGPNIQENEDRKNSEEVEDDDDDEEEEIKKELQFLTRPPRPTRSGRIPQQKHPLSIPSPTRKPVPKHSKPVLPLQDLSNVEPGSLVVIATQSPTNPGHQVYKVFMVAPPSQTGSAPAIAPVALSPKIMQSSSEQTNLQLCNSGTLSFTSTQAVCPATPPQNASNCLRDSCSTSDVNSLSTACSQVQPTSLQTPCSASQESHSSSILPQSSPVSKHTTFATDLQPNNTEVLSMDTHFVPIILPGHQCSDTADINSQNMSIANSDDVPIQVSQSNSTFIPISCPQSSLPSSQQTKILESPKSDVIVSQSLPPVVYLEHAVISDTGKQSNISPVKDSALQNSSALSTVKDDSPQCTPSSPNCGLKGPKIYNSSNENTEEDNNAR